MIRKLFKDYLVYSAIIVKWLYDAFLEFYLFHILCHLFQMMIGYNLNLICVVM